ncbi:MAG: hypothetical protein AB1657_01015 [Candidatus Micrarchaeota archaeon]
MVERWFGREFNTNHIVGKVNAQEVRAKSDKEKWKGGMITLKRGGKAFPLPLGACALRDGIYEKICNEVGHGRNWERSEFNPSHGKYGV